MIESITYYDWAELRYMSPFLNGFEQDSKSKGYSFHVCKSQPDIMNDPVFKMSKNVINRTGLKGGTRVNLNSIGLFKARLSGNDFYFCLDAGDHSHLEVTNEGVHYGFNIPLLERVRFYFKVNYNKKAIYENTLLDKWTEKIFPIPIVYAAPVQCFWKYLPHNFPMSLFSGNRSIGIQRMKQLANLSTMGDLKKYRSSPTEFDTIFITTFYGGNGGHIHRVNNEFRYELIAKLRESKTLKTLTGFASKSELPGKYEQFRINSYRLNQYYKTCSRSKVGIYVRGTSDCLSFKLGDLLQMGLPIIGQPLLNNQEFYYGHPLFNKQFSFEEPDEIIEGLNSLVENPSTINDWGHANAKFFDSNLAPLGLVSNITKTLYN